MHCRIMSAYTYQTLTCVTHVTYRSLTIRSQSMRLTGLKFQINLLGWQQTFWFSHWLNCLGKKP